MAMQVGPNMPEVSMQCNSGGIERISNAMESNLIFPNEVTLEVASSFVDIVRPERAVMHTPADVLDLQFNAVLAGH